MNQPNANHTRPNNQAAGGNKPTNASSSQASSSKPATAAVSKPASPAASQASSAKPATPAISQSPATKPASPAVSHSQPSASVPKTAAPAPQKEVAASKLETKPQAVASKQPTLPTVRFEVEAPKASNVSVAGTFNNWKPGATPLAGIGGGKWAKELPLAPGRYEYRFVVDGQWIDDAKAKAYAPNPHGGRNAVLEVHARN